jgi:hypothetical protein
MNYEYLLKSISYNNTDVLIFCGYGSMAREFLNGLRFEYVGKENFLKRPKVILSDGARISDIKEVSTIFGFDAYLSFPSDKLASKRQFADFNPETPPRGQEKMKLEESYEIFGYDALSLFSFAFKNLKGNISRQLLNESLRSESLEGNELSYNYKFVKGENVDARYFVYEVGSDSIDTRYDGAYLNSVFTDKAVAEFIGQYDNKAASGTELLDILANRLESDPSAKAIIMVSDDRQRDDATRHATESLKYLLGHQKIGAKRVDFAVGVGPKSQTRIWLLPLEAASPKSPDNLLPVNGEDLLSKLPSAKQLKKN